MQVKVIMSGKEKKIALILLAIILIVLYILNRNYLYILDAEFENASAKKILLKTGFLFPVKVWVDFGKEPTEQKIKFYDLTAKGLPILDDNKKPTGEYSLEIYRGKQEKPFKSVKIFTDDYYVKYLKTPLGKI